MSERTSLMEQLQGTDSSQNQETDEKKTINALTKLEQFVSEKPELFTNVGDDINERLDHLICLIQYQSNQIDDLKHNQHLLEEQLQRDDPVVKR